MPTDPKVFYQFKSALDLNDKDLDIYIDLFQFGASAASTIAARTRIDRTTVYAVLKRLINKGVVVKTIRNNTNIFVALDPNVFEQRIQNEINERQDQLESFQKIIPQLLNFKITESTRPDIQIFEGPSSIISLYEQLLHSSKNHDAFLTVEKMPALLKKYLTHEYIQKKLKLKVKSRVLVENSPRAEKYKSLDAKANRITKLVPKGQFPFETEIIISDADEIAIIDFRKEIIGVYIKSPSIRNTLKAVFELIWNVN